MSTFIVVIAVLAFALLIHWTIWTGLFGLLVWAFDLPFTRFQIGIAAGIAAFLTAGRI